MTSDELTKQKSDAQDEYEFEVRSDGKPNGAPIAGADGVDGVDQKKDGKAPVEAVRRYWWAWKRHRMQWQLSITDNRPEFSIIANRM